VHLPIDDIEELRACARRSPFPQPPLALAYGPDLDAPPDRERDLELEREPEWLRELDAPYLPEPRRPAASARPMPGPGASQRVRDACGLDHARDAHETFAAYRRVALDGGPYDPLFLPRARLAPHLPLCLRRRTCSPRTSRRGLAGACLLNPTLIVCSFVLVSMPNTIVFYKMRDRLRVFSSRASILRRHVCVLAKRGIPWVVAAGRTYRPVQMSYYYEYIPVSMELRKVSADAVGAYRVTIYRAKAYIAPASHIFEGDPPSS
jgi:hypothetical protein